MSEAHDRLDDLLRGLLATILEGMPVADLPPPEKATLDVVTELAKRRVNQLKQSQTGQRVLLQTLTLLVAGIGCDDWSTCILVGTLEEIGRRCRFPFSPGFREKARRARLCRQARGWTLPGLDEGESAPCHATTELSGISPGGTTSSATTSRQRLFVQAVRGREQIRWPEPTHTRNPRQDLFGSLLPWRGAREVIDWSVKGQSIFTRKRPLRENTLRRIRAGLEKFGGAAARPFLMMLSQTGSNGSRMREVTDPLPTITSADDIGIVEPFTVQFKGTSPSNVPYTARRVDQPLGTITGGGGDFGVIEPMILSAGGPEVAARPVSRPVNTLLGRDQMAVVEPLILGQQSGAAARPVSEPLPTVAGAGAISITQPFLVPTNYGERPGQAPRTHGVNAPLPTVVGSVTHGLVQPYLVPYYGTGEADSLNDPARTLTGRDRLGLVEPVEPIPGVTHDILFRMLLPSELAAAMSFPPDYVFKGNRGQVVKQIGNAVDCLQMEVLAGALVDAYLARCA